MVPDKGEESFYAAAERRVELVTGAVGIAAAVVAAVVWGWLAGAGVAIGSGIAWVNLRWLRLGVNALVNSSVAQSDESRPRIPRAVYVKFFGRYALLLAVVYVILSRSVLPVAALIGGLFASVAAVVLEAIWELMTGKLGAKSHT